MRGPFGQHDVLLRLAADGELVAAVDQRRGERAVVDDGPAIGTPGGAQKLFIAPDGEIAHRFHRVAAVLQDLAICDQPLEFDGADFGAVLDPLTGLLRVFVGGEAALDTIAAAVEDIDQRPQQVGKVGFGTCRIEREGECVEHFGDGAFKGLWFGRRPVIGFAIGRTIAVELHRQHGVVGGGSRVFGFVVVVGVAHLDLLCRDRAPAARPSAISCWGPQGGTASEAAPLAFFKRRAAEDRNAEEEGGTPLF